MRLSHWLLPAAFVSAGSLGLLHSYLAVAAEPKAEDPVAMAAAEIKARPVKPGDWPQWGGWTHRNNTPDAKNIPIEWDIQTGKNILWSAPLGSQTYGNVVIANGKAYIGTNNHHAWLKRYPLSLIHI